MTLLTSRDDHLPENMVDAHCAREEGGFTLHWLVVAFHSVRVRVKIVNIVQIVK